jgi:chromosome partitioning protein
MQAPLAPVILRARSVYQTALERGRSAEEMADRAAAAEIAALWDYVQGQLALTEDSAATLNAWR